MVLLREKRERDVKRRGDVHGAEHSGEEELTPARDPRTVKTYQGEPTRAPAARWQSEATVKTELALANWSGQNG